MISVSQYNGPGDKKANKGVGSDLHPFNFSYDIKKMYVQRTKLKNENIFRVEKKEKLQHEAPHSCYRKTFTNHRNPQLLESFTFLVYICSLWGHK